MTPKAGPDDDPQLVSTRANRATPGWALGLRLSEPSYAWLGTLALLFAYLASMARDLSLYDSPELQLAAVVLGLGHPPGQPLHTLLGHVLSYLPLPGAVAVGLASALPGALCVMPATAIAEQLAGDALRVRTRRALPFLLAALGLIAPLWEPATRVEVYALASFFGLWAVARLTPRERSQRDVFAAAVALGLCASANPMIAFLIGIGLAPSLIMSLARRTLGFRAVPLALLGGGLGLLPYAYVPLVALRDDVMVWGAPRDAQSLAAFLLLRDYAANQQVTLSLWTEHFIAFFPHAAGRGLLALIVLGTMAHISLGRRTALGAFTGPLLLALLVGVISFNVVWNLDVPDYNGYLATPLWLLAAGVAAGCALLHVRARVGLSATLTALVLLSAWLAPPAVHGRTRHRDGLVRALSERVLAEAPRDAIVISSADLFSAALLYLQEAEGQRPDVVVLVHGLASSSWHWERIYREHRDLAPFALRGPGGRDARIARFLDANPGREVRIERLEVARALERRACAGGLYLRSGAACASPAAPALLTEATELLTEQLARVGRGSPSAQGAIADVSFALGEALWQLGAPREAYRVLLAGVPAEHKPAAAHALDLEALERATPPPPLAPFRRGAALGDPARNLLRAAMLASAAERDDIASQFVAAAADLELPEALSLVAAPR